jgi:aminobenzoyl-glutamate utilization protein B
MVRHRKEINISYLMRFMKQVFAFLLALILLPATAQQQDPRDTAESYLEQNAERFYTISDSIWAYAELGCQEYWSSALLADTLEQEGFEVERGISGMPTAFVASYGSGKPIIGFLAEFDALPGLSQKAGVSKQEAVIEGAPGHGCGHNTMGTAAVAAAMATKRAMQEEDIKGTIKVFGTPAEESLSGKIYMARDGLFDGIDAVLDNHASSSMGTEYGVGGLAIKFFEVTFHGKTAHAAGAPWQGRSALDAVELMDIAVNFLREHIEPDARIHYVITEGGEAPNIVPEKATVRYYVRETDSQLESLYDRVLKCAEGAAIATECTYDVKVIKAYHQQYSNKALAEVIQKNAELVGMPEWSEDEVQFAERIQRELGTKEVGLMKETEELREASPTGGSTDVGDVSLVAPTATLSIPVYAPGSPGHHWSIVTATPTGIGHKGMIAGAKVLSFSAIDLLTETKLLDGIKEEFSALQKENPYVPFISEDKKPERDMYTSEAERWRSAKLEDWNGYWANAFGSMEISG